MSSADAALVVPGRGAPAAPRHYPGALSRQLRSELRLAFGRRRNQILLFALGAIPLAIGIAVKTSPPGGRGGDGPQFLNRITDSGLFLVLPALMAGALGFGIRSSVRAQIPQLHAIHPGLISNYWQSFGTLIRVGPDFGQLGRYLLLQAVYVAVAGGLAWARFVDADVTS